MVSSATISVDAADALQAFFFASQHLTRSLPAVFSRDMVLPAARLVRPAIAAAMGAAGRRAGAGLTTTITTITTTRRVRSVVFA